MTKLVLNKLSDEEVVYIFDYLNRNQPTQPKKFKITEKGLYRTRDDRKAYVFKIYKDNRDYPVCAVIEDCDLPATYTREGRWHAEFEAPEDIVEKWVF